MLTYDDFSPAQKDAIERIYSRNTLLVAPKGFGKCAVGHTAAQELCDDGEVKRVLVLGPLKVCELTWASEHVKWAHLRPPAMATGNEKSRIAAIEGDSPVVVINFDNLPWLAKRYGSAWPFDGLLVDESTRLKSAGGKWMRALRRALPGFSWRCAMTANPVAEQGADIYTQALIVDNGAALGRSKDAFLRKYFYPTDYMQRHWALQPGAQEKITKSLRGILYTPHAHDYEAGLPELVDKWVRLSMPEDARAVYDELCQELCVELGDSEVEAANTAVLAGKLLQSTAGALYVGEGYERLHTLKVRTAVALVAQAGKPVAIAYWFRHELDALREAIPGLGVLADDPAGVQERWNAGELPVIAVHPASAGHGLNLQYGGDTLIVLTQPWSADQWEQLLGRFRRRGQRSKKVTRITLGFENTIDDIVRDKLRGKKDSSAALLEHLTSGEVVE